VYVKGASRVKKGPRAIERLLRIKGDAVLNHAARAARGLPLDDRYGERYHQGPALARGRTHFVYHQGVYGIPEGSAPNLKGRSHRIEVDLTMPEAGASGMLVTAGGRFGGYGLYVKDGRLHYVHNVSGLERHTVVSDRPLKPGRQRVRMTFGVELPQLGAGGEVRFSIDGEDAGRGAIARPRFSECGVLFCLSSRTM
jgi:arylsulfatase